MVIDWPSKTWRTIERPDSLPNCNVAMVHNMTKRKFDRVPLLHWSERSKRSTIVQASVAARGVIEAAVVDQVRDISRTLGSGTRSCAKRGGYPQGRKEIEAKIFSFGRQHAAGSRRDQATSRSTKDLAAGIASIADIQERFEES